MSFTLHPQLQADCHPVVDLPFSQVLLLNDARYPWLVLVPRHPHAVELTDLTLAQQQQVLLEVNAGLAWVAAVPGVSKTNLGALGNLVSQLHVHVIGRHIHDPAWPGPVWGHSAPQPYAAEAAQQRIQAARTALPEMLRAHSSSA